MQHAIRGMEYRDCEKIFVAVQFHARTADEAARELGELLEALDTDYVDALTYYYVEHPDEWELIVAKGGAATTLEAARNGGRVRPLDLRPTNAHLQR